MKKTSKLIDLYNPNKQVEVRVTNTPKYEDDVLKTYNRTVTIKIKLPQDKDPLKFVEEDSIAKFVETVDFEDPQTELDLTGDDPKKGIK